MIIKLAGSAGRFTSGYFNRIVHALSARTISEYRRRVDALLRIMTLEEKIGQMSQLSARDTEKR